MRFPIKPNWRRAPEFASRLVPWRGDPRETIRGDLSAAEFESAISGIKIDATWKTTESARHTRTDSLILERSALDANLSILEIGASCGSTSLDLLERIGGRFGRYYVTDRFLEIPYRRNGPVVYFYHPRDGSCILRASDWTITYADAHDAIAPMRLIANALIAGGQRFDGADRGLADTIRPDLRDQARDDPRITIVEHDCLQPWPASKVDVVKAANVLNQVYFSDTQILTAVSHLRRALRPGGCLLITDNKDVERATSSSRSSGIPVERVSSFVRSDDARLTLTDSIDGGSHIEQLIRDAEFED